MNSNFYEFINVDQGVWVDTINTCNCSGRLVITVNLFLLLFILNAYQGLT